MAQTRTSQQTPLKSGSGKSSHVTILYGMQLRTWRLGEALQNSQTEAAIVYGLLAQYCWQVESLGA